MRAVRVTRLLVVFAALTLAATTASVAFAGGRPLTATLLGVNERPGPGDPDGSGFARITLNQGQGEVCWEITVENITLPTTGAHIHIGDANVAGPVVIALTPPDASGTSAGCTSADPALIKAIRQEPWAYYVNVHTLPLYAAGAIRGQLTK